MPTENDTHDDEPSTKFPQHHFRTETGCSHQRTGLNGIGTKDPAIMSLMRKYPGETSRP